MQKKFCLQCKKLLVNPTNRLVQDSCGHKKCRVCLLEDVEKCKQCVVDSIKQNGVVDRQKDCNVSKEDITGFEKNHTAVIHCNGNKPDDSVNCKNSNDEDFCEKYSIIQEARDNVSNKKKEPIGKLKTFDKKKPILVIKRDYKPVAIPSHITETVDPVAYHCNICNKTFITKCHVKYHVFCAGEVKPFKCFLCEKEFILKKQLDVHMYKHNGLKPFKCNICQKSFDERHKLSRHLAVHSEVKTHVCTDCGKSFRSKESLRLHGFIHKEEKPYVCNLCPLKFNNSSNLKKHVVSHSKEKVHMCDQCGKRFKLKWALSVHRKSHLKVRPHKCSACSKAFVNKKDLQRHNLIHAETKGFMCSICKTVFRRKDNLYRHMKNSHPGKKGEVIKNVVKATELEPKKPIIDNPNAINVITASPAFTNSKAEVAQPVKSTDSRPGTVINGPIKLAFKTPAFKSIYNINRDFNYVPPSQSQKTYDLAESVDICQRILSPHCMSTSGDVIQKTNEATSSEICQKILSPYSVPNCKTDEPTSAEICQKILSPYSATMPPIHYETSFQNRKHAMIKNIKFKVPIQYTTNNIKHISLVNTITVTQDSVNGPANRTYTELKPILNTTASVIVNNNNINQASDVHWRRRTSQNLALKS